MNQPPASKKLHGDSLYEWATRKPRCFMKSHPSGAVQKSLSLRVIQCTCFRERGERERDWMTGWFEGEETLNVLNSSHVAMLLTGPCVTSAVYPFVRPSVQLRDSSQDWWRSALLSHAIADKLWVRTWQIALPRCQRERERERETHTHIQFNFKFNLKCIA